MTPHSLLDDLKCRLQPILENAPVEFSLLFGSSSRGEPFRDLDIAVRFQPEHGHLKEILDLGLRLERAAGVPVDLVSLTQATLAFQYEVSKGELLTAHNRESFYDWRETTWSEYFQIEHLLRSHALEYARIYGGTA